MEELLIFVAPAIMGVGLWLILRQKPDEQDADEQDDDDRPAPS